MNKRRVEFIKKTPVICFVAMICCFLWGSAFPCIKIGYQLFGIENSSVATKILFAGYRFAIAGILVLIIGSILNKSPLLFKKESAKDIVVLSLFQTILQYLFFYIGLANTTGVKASIIIGANVFIAILIATLVFHQEKLTKKKLTGCFLGFIGVVLINLNGSGFDFDMKFTGEGFILLSTVAYAISSAVMKKYAKKENPIALSGYQFLLGGIVMILCGAFLGGKITVVTGSGLLMLIYLAFVSAVAYTLWAVLLKYNPLSKVAVFGFMNPIFGVVLSAILLNEKNQAFGAKSIIALILVCLGILIVNYNEKGSKNNEIIKED